MNVNQLITPANEPLNDKITEHLALAEKHIAAALRLMEHSGAGYGDYTYQVTRVGDKADELAELELDLSLTNGHEP